jgi:hypothetical protein
LLRVAGLGPEPLVKLLMEPCQTRLKSFHDSCVAEHENFLAKPNHKKNYKRCELRNNVGIESQVIRFLSVTVIILVWPSLSQLHMFREKKVIYSWTDRQTNSNQPAVLFSQNKPAISNQTAVLFPQNKPAPAISHQLNEQATILTRFSLRRLAGS